jgi:hypothetical protein
MPRYKCRFCHLSFDWDKGHHGVIWSRILVHLMECDRAAGLSRDARSMEARREADRIGPLRPRTEENAADRHGR